MFEYKHYAIEILIYSRELEGGWRAAGYGIL
jgi:hypothetical protein